MEEYTFNIKPVREMYYSDSSSFGVYSFETDEEIPELEKSIGLDNFNTVYTGVLSGKMQKLYIGDTYTVTATLNFNKNCIFAFLIQI